MGEARRERPGGGHGPQRALRVVLRIASLLAAAAVAIAIAWLTPGTQAAPPPDRSSAPPGRGEEEERDRYWPQWRGPRGTGLAPRANPPVTWSERTGVRWKVPLPGRGHSTPVIWGDRVFLTTSVSSGRPVEPPGGERPGAHDNAATVRRQQFVVLALRREDGTILWQRAVHEAVPHETGHRTASFASASPVTDGERVIASFGSHGIYCLDTRDGHLLWKADLGDMHTLHGHGEGSSPALAGDSVIVNWDHEGPSFVAALDKRTGERRWMVPRDEATSWSTPLVVEHAGRPQVIIGATRRIRSYDPPTGAVIWECGGLSTNVVASPVAGEGIVCAGSSYEKRAMLAIRLDGARGDVTGTEHVAWTRDRDTPYVPSPLLYGDRLYFLRHYQGFLTCVDVKTGRTLFGPSRLEGVYNVYASLVGAAGRVYITSMEGSVLVLENAPELRVLATNQLDDEFAASPALVDGELYLRGERSLYCVSEATPRQPRGPGRPGRP
jgi:outer membrane protein assembly factor BamB